MNGGSKWDSKYKLVARLLRRESRIRLSVRDTLLADDATANRPACPISLPDLGFKMVPDINDKNEARNGKFYLRLIRSCLKEEIGDAASRLVVEA
jgi:hypothetical protein